MKTSAQTNQDCAHTELLKAIELAGSQSALARLCGSPIKQAHIWNWLNRDKKIPVKYALLISEVFKGRISIYRLCPDVFPQEDTS